MSELTVTPEYVNNSTLDELVTWYPGQSGPQPIELCLDLEDGTFWFRVNPEIGRSMPARHWHGLVQRWEVPAPLTPNGANAYLDELVDDAQAILNDSTVYWDGSNRVGSVGPEGQEADERIEAELGDERDIPEDRVVRTVEASDAYIECASEVLHSTGLTAATSDEQLDRMADDLEAEAASEGMVIRSVVDWLREQRAEMRRQVEDELGEVVDRLKADTIRRDELVNTMYAWCSQRDLADRIEVSQGTVSNLLNRQGA
ncbi:hypothetical protein SAMN04487905_1069 [Actinopolyspora xinjiangensis]|uniref:Uncharacterized protein n=1 Tax=Actinopolyspora xinjiangensis TaxID=405564 RepID=A0A1H0U3N3_9ACTN|nr:hypothetical protein [Actinopolyspora xinjiangensis]SDP60446.1 hypothetical protein SAMN04487905_1069 [Actinopolyspora xinjiangensis]